MIHFKTAPFTKTEQKKVYVSLGDHEKQVYQFDYSNGTEHTDYLLSVIHKKGSGPRDNMPYMITDILGKLQVETGKTSNLLLKFQYHNQDARVTYTGLNQSMYDSDPDQNAASWDALLVDRLAFSATHHYFGLADTLISNTFYAYRTSRDWWRRDVEDG